MADRDLWIDRAFHASNYRVRERIGADVKTLGEFPVRAQAMIFMDRTLNPEKYEALERAEAEAKAAKLAEKAKAESKENGKPTWTRGARP